MSRVLLRSAKDPFLPVSPEASLARNLFATNSGNMLFTQAMHKLLAAADVEVVADGHVADRVDLLPETVAKINDEFDAYVIPLANAFRPGFANQLRRLTRLINQLQIPVVVAGVGAQATPNATELPENLQETVAAFLSAVLDKSAKIGVRGDITRRCLAALGFGDEHVEVIGCPSLYASGRELTVTKNDHGLSADSPIAANLTLSQVNVAKIINRAVDRYPQMIYIPQTIKELRMLLWGVPLPGPIDENMPATLDHPLYRQGRVRFFLDPIRWHRFLAERQFAFGSRIHGNIAALAVGTPAFLLAFDSRTIELADYHAIPYALARDVAPDTDPAELYDRADFTGFNAAQPENVDRFLAFLEKNGLAHSQLPGRENPEFDRRLAEVDFPPAVRPAFGGGDEAIDQLLSRLRWLYQGEDVDRARSFGAYEPRPFGKLPEPVKAPEPARTVRQTSPAPAPPSRRRRAIRRFRRLVRRIRS
ncbi:polysaccharide pyruvyl transferase family protein [Microlunatus sp. Gsoil 973]|uniref:polysaccharide pyruvyl transferase family protein n=1 Tax=Microlunatus sp. Gsoil 973 TaxID=2672569 RepID=UPI0012B4C02F|nr:polysaccharide pyruvyl transferase family protein [Microlunatus sp. Gsoil 973]QGN34142.1 polysaccharide pyruvyl transferase family protein [Microlunatus sp. Gsoil 973]